MSYIDQQPDGEVISPPDNLQTAQRRLAIVLVAILPLSAVVIAAIALYLEPQTPWTTLLLLGGGLLVVGLIAARVTTQILSRTAASQPSTAQQPTSGSYERQAPDHDPKQIAAPYATLPTADFNRSKLDLDTVDTGVPQHYLKKHPFKIRTVF
jgi:hypothetical protein